MGLRLFIDFHKNNTEAMFMAFTSLSLEARGSEMLRSLGISLAFFSALTGVEQSKLSLGFRQLKVFSAREREVLQETLADLLHIQTHLAPLSLDFRSPENTRAVLKALRGKTEEEIRTKVDSLFQ